MISSTGFSTCKDALVEAAQNSIVWSNLSKAEQEQGVHPAKLGALRFNIDGSELSGELLQKLHRFFVGCRLATSDSDFFSKSMLILNSNDQLLQPIRTIVERVIHAQMPKENLLQDDAAVRFEGEGCGDHVYKAKFEGVYNRLIEEKMCYLMHPARRSELVEYLGVTFSDVELAADRLITYRCFGSYALSISELERSLQKYMEELEHVERRLSSLFENGPNLIINPMELQEEALVCIADKHCRKYVCLAYKELASQGKLDCLDLHEEELHKFQGMTLDLHEEELYSNGPVHPNLAPFAKAYYRKVSIGSNHFGVVVKYLKELRNSDLNDLMQICLNEEKERLNCSIDYIKDHLVNAKVNYQNQLSLLGKKPEDYKPGDFSFLSNPSTICMLTKAYNAVNRLNEWPFFDIAPPENKGYMFWKHPTVNKIGSELGGDGYFTADTFRSMQSIRKKGWNVVVRENIENKAETAGALNRAWAIR